jgi:TRAP-type C4-dicarboxylate transport system permease small subunit
METFRSALNWVVKLIRLVGAIALVAMMTVTCVDVVFRGFGHPMIYTLDMVGFLAVICLACALPVTHVEGGHVGVDLLVQKMKPRNQAILDSITSFVSFVIFGLIAWQMWQYATELSSKGEVSMTVMIPKAPFIYFVSVCFMVFCLAILADVLTNIKKAVQE